MTNFADIFRNMHFLCKTIFRLPETVRKSAIKVLVKSLKTVFYKVYIIINLPYHIAIKNMKMTWNIICVIHVFDILQFFSNMISLQFCQ